jgi:DNA-binding transcriptional LysR family regulator
MKNVTWAEVAGVPLCLLTPDMQNRRIIDELLTSGGGDRPAPMLESNSVIALLSHIRTGQWATVMPVKLVEIVGLASSVCAIPIVEPRAIHTIGLIVPNREVTSPLAAALIAEALEIASAQLNR